MDIYINENEFKTIDLNDPKTYPRLGDFCFVQQKPMMFLAEFIYQSKYPNEYWHKRWKTPLCNWQERPAYINVQTGDKYMPVNLIFDQSEDLQEIKSI